MAKKIEDYKVDQRALRLNIQRGEITKQEYEVHLKTLPDLSKQLVEIPAIFEEEEPEAGDSGDLTFSVA